MEKILPEILRGKPCPVHCPICQANLNIDNYNFNCLNGHRFDHTDAGYINLLPKPTYSRTRELLLNARHHLIANGLFDRLERELLRILYAEYAVTDSLTILDAGTGEGTLFRNILLCMQWDQYRHQAIGLDNCRTALEMAASQYPSALWLLADLAEMPLKDSSVDVILNILAPCKYSEFYRVLRPGGLILKIIPGPSHLVELQKMENYKMELNAGFFNDHTEDLKQIRVCYQKELYGEELEWLETIADQSLNMDQDRSRTALLQKITIDLVILCGRKSEWAY